MVFKILNYLARIFLAYTYIPHGFEKLTQKIDVQEYIDYKLGQEFIDFYLSMERSGYIWVIGFFQVLGGLLLVFKRTYLLGSVVLMPLSIGMLSCHVFISHQADFLIFDAIVLVFNLYLVFESYRILVSTFFSPQKTWI